MRIRPLGLSDSFSRSGRGFPSFLFANQNGHAMIDVPPDFMERLFALGLNPLDISELYITHFHDDHVGGLRRFLEFRYIAQKNQERFTFGGYLRLGQELKHLDICCPSDGSVQFLQLLGWVARENRFDTTIHVIDFNSQIGMLSPALGDIKVFAQPSKHSVSCVGYKLNDQVVISGDTAYDEGYIKWLSDVRLIFCEFGFAGPHMKVEDIQKISLDVRRKMRMYHVPDPVYENWDNLDLGVALAKLRWYEEGKDF
ncbi:hypothetical protein COT97_02590 [Candidatus Falkowbacteria bacterium CG10_big_fil_rev_8_21_14_0_10_39_11]|uniref:Uncharacterized protein n=1 Tax=Candidatus Falkowbacteria bacterium CG10_big_fil_rev_8_21_14_0_10_39_11 TaxID=1974565 RepID=A0A2H0V510_9BACT|nr:MAG: hypothetical protein COT97_02590 [Candidatus Falkowbacteria bacterium CG10_big_fil_rev_8_21_14_0_10_39_11]